MLCPITEKEVVLDYDNTHIFTEKKDAKMTYLKHRGYCPGVALIGDRVVYVENRNGNSTAHALQHDTLGRMFGLLADDGIRADVFRADSASYQFDTVQTVAVNVGRLYIKARMGHGAGEAVNKVRDWRKVEVEGRTMYRGSVMYTPSRGTARKAGRKDEVEEYRLVVTKEPRSDGQVNVFTGEASMYSCVMTNDLESSDDRVTCFYNMRGGSERQFDILKNDFGWKNMPYSGLADNTAFLLLGRHVPQRVQLPDTQVLPGLQGAVATS